MTEGAPSAQPFGLTRPLKFRADIDGLRGGAVTAVVLYHFELLGFKGGYVGVDVFFVISGFLITSLILSAVESRNFSLLHFYERRVRRIIPALYLVAALCFAAAFVVLLPNQFANFAQSAKSAVIFVSNHTFWNEGTYFDAKAASKPLLHTWSLSIEEQFYVLFPLLMIFIARWSRVRVTAVLGFIAVCSLALSEWGVVNHPNAAFYLAPTRAWELLVGALIAVHAERLSAGPRIRNVCGSLGIALVLWSIFGYAHDTGFPGIAALLPTLGTALVIVAGLREGAIPTRAILCGRSAPFPTRFICGTGRFLFSPPCYGPTT